MKDDISVLIAGEAGDGILFTGNVLARVLKRPGWKKSWKNSDKGTILLF
ncbi:MAG TPA: hypothetical protein VGB72_00840 [Acidobacteriota bacterium]